MYMNLCMSAVHANIVLSVPLMCTTTVCKRNGREWNEGEKNLKMNIKWRQSVADTVMQG